MDPTKPILSPKAAAFLFVILAAAWTCVVFPPLQLAWASASWPKAEAQVIESAYQRQGKNLAVRINYTYVVAGAKYIGTNYDSLDVYRGWSNEKVFANYPVGANVSISYEPEDPSTAFLVAGFSARQFVLLGACLFLWLVAVLFLRTAFRRRRTRR